MSCVRTEDVTPTGRWGRSPERAHKRTATQKRQRALQDRKADVKERMREQKVQHEKQREARAEAAAALQEKLKSVPRALHRLHKRGQQ